MITVNIQSAWSSIQSAKIRTMLTTVGVIIGVIFFVLISSVVDGLESGVRKEIEGYGENLITISPGNTIIRDEDGNIEDFNFAAVFGASTLTERDIETIAKIDQVESFAPQMVVSGKVSRDEHVFPSGFIMATSSQYPTVLGQELESGSFFKDKARANVAIVGSGLVDELFAGTVSLGSSISVRGKQFTIIGVMEKQKSLGAGFGPDLNNAVFIPLETGKEFNGGVALIQKILVQLKEDSDVSEVTGAMNESLLENHGGEEDFTIFEQEEVIGITSSIFSLTKNFSNIVSVIIMLIGGIVILLVMLITVKERSREIGLRKAVGATNRDIMEQFMVEALVVTWFGVFVGSIVAVVIGLTIGILSELTPVFTLNTFLVALGLSTIFGLVGGIAPAILAAYKDPIEALRN